MDKKDVAIGILPALFAVPLLGARIPIFYHSMREVTQYFQARALLATGLESYTYLTPHESRAGFHLYSLLSAPFIELGYFEAGRLISLVSAVIAAALIIYITYELSGSRDVAVLSALFLWAHPLFFRHAYSFVPEALTIALTLAALAATLRYVRTDDSHWFWAGVLAMVVGVANHTWEATILLPVVVLLFFHNERKRAVAAAAVTVGWVGASRYLIYALDPTEYSYSGAVGLFSVGPVFLSLDWWLGHFTSIHPFAIAIGLTLPLALLATAAWIFRAQTTLSETNLVMVSWFCSGLAIPFLLPGALPWHRYYMWGVLTPLAVTGGFAAVAFIQVLRERLPTVQKMHLTKATMVLLVVGAGFNGLVVEGGYLADSGAPVVGDLSGVAQNDIDGVPAEEAVAAGEKIRRLGSHSSSILFVGDWENQSLTWENSGRVLVYSGVNIRSFVIRNAANVAFGANATGFECDFRAIRRGDDITIRRCS